MKLNNIFLGLIPLVQLNSPCFAKEQNVEKPNIIIILADDLGYGDLGCYGHPTIRTPNIDRMASQGMRFTQFYVGANICSPSRAALLTGRLPIRYGLTGNRGVFFPNSSGGLPKSEITIASALKSKNYVTGIIGKWHLGHLPEYLPTNRGFDYYFGIPYSNDMIPFFDKNNPPLPLYRNTEIVEKDPDQSLLTKRYTEEVVSFIKGNKDKPFFLYYPNNFPHVPLYASSGFKGKSKRGLFGDVVEELDWSIGQILKTLKDLNLDKKTLVIFTSDNGPWLIKNQDGGSGGILFEGKGSTWEGGMRVPAIAWWPGIIPENKINTSLAASMDLFPTILKLAKVDLPKDRIYDGQDMMPLLLGKDVVTRDLFFYYNQGVESAQLYAVRKGVWKAHFLTKPSYSKEPSKSYEIPLLYNIENDPSEKYDVSQQNPEIIEEIKKEMEKHKSGVITVPSLMKQVIPENP